MDRELAKELKAAGFPIKAYQPRHGIIRTEECRPGWPEATRTHGVTVTAYELKNRLQDINNGYYCPTLFPTSLETLRRQSFRVCLS